MKAKLVKFNDDGTKCNYDIEYLKKNPQCGVRFMQPFKPHNRTFDIKILDREVEGTPDIATAPKIKKPGIIGGAISSSPYTNQYLPQDETNKYDLTGRRILADTEHGNNIDEYTATKITNAFNPRGYNRVPIIGNDSYSHETPETTTTRRIGDVELEDFGAGRGIPLQDINNPNQEPPPTLRQTRIRFRDVNNPNIEESIKPRGMTDDELLNQQMEQLTRNSTQEEATTIERNIRRGGKSKAKVRVTEQEMFPIEPMDEYKVVSDEVDKILRTEDTLTNKQKENLIKEMQSRGISRQRVEEILEEANVFDFALEEAMGGSNRPKIERLARLLQRGLRQIPTRDTNLLPERQASIELREDTPLTRGRTDLGSGRSRVEKVYDKVAGKLPEELRTLAGSIKRNTQEFNENIRTKSFEAIQNVRATTTRVFGQRYSNIVDAAIEVRGGENIELQAPEGAINIRPPVTEEITGIRTNDLEALDFDPLGADYLESFTTERPQISFARRIGRGAFSGDAAVGGAGAAGGVLVGFGVAELMKKAGVNNEFAIAAGSGAAGGAGARILTMAGSRALTRGATTAIVETAAYATIRGGTSVLRGAAEGGVIGLALMPLDMLLNDFLVNKRNFKHWEANLTSGTLVGAGGAGLTTIGLASIGAAPETLGASLIVGGVAMAVTGIIGAITGYTQDKKEEEQRKERDRAVQHLRETATFREILLESLPKYKYDFTKALEAFPEKDKLGIDDDTWDNFSTSSTAMFKMRPNNHPLPPAPTPSEAPTEDERRVNEIFNKYVVHRLIRKVCKGGVDCNELKKTDQGPITDEERAFINEKTDYTWVDQANMTSEMNIQELNYTRQRIGDAQTQMLNAWNNNQQIANQLDPYIVQTAQIDTTFMQRYNLAIRLDAQQRVVDAYQTNQTRIEELPQNIRDIANTDPDFNYMIQQYYTSIEDTAASLDISVPQVIVLQTLTGDAQRDRYESFQFDNIKQNKTIVDEAKEISIEEDQVREARFYDIDQAYLETDPTAITSWKPTDSQILQAHSAGMTLQEYVNYMHELALGSSGNYSNLPKYSETELRASGILDYSHFQDELQMAGYRKDLYLYNEETRQFTLNPNITNSVIPSTQTTFTSRYTPRYLLEARSDYSDMIQGLNEKNQNQVDNFNSNLMRELSSYGKHYDSMVADINNERLYEGRSDLLYYDVGKMYDQNKIEFKPLSDQLKDASVLSQPRQLGQQTRINNKRATAEEYGLSVNQYDEMKNNLEDKGISNVSQREIDEAVQEVKQNYINKQNFLEANPNLDRDFTDNQINTLMDSGTVTDEGGTYASF